MTGLGCIAAAGGLLLAQAAAPDPEALDGALEKLGGADLVLFESPARTGAPQVRFATRVRADAAALRRALEEPLTYQRAVPAFRRAEVRPSPPGDAPKGAKLVAWELEIPLWNLSGELWLTRRPDGVTLELVRGDFAPGSFRITVTPRPGGALMVVDGRANVRDANWLTKRLVARSPTAEPAMLAAATAVLARAVALGAEPADARRRPTGAIRPPSSDAFGGEQLAAIARTPLGSRAVVAAIRSRPDGRLAFVEVAAPTGVEPDRARREAANPRRWETVPAWRKVTPLEQAPPAVRWEVDSRFPFVDFDAVWELRTSPLRGKVVKGEAKGAAMGLDVFPSGVAGRSIAVLSLHPRIETSGYIPRRFIEAEPLLEHGLSLGLAYVNALAVTKAIEGSRQGGQ